MLPFFVCYFFCSCFANQCTNLQFLFYADDVMPATYCEIDLDKEKRDAFVYAIKNHYWYQMYIDDLPIWGKHCMLYLKFGECFCIISKIYVMTLLGWLCIESINVRTLFSTEWFQHRFYCCLLLEGFWCCQSLHENPSKYNFLDLKD